jgi:hypothetical protein
VPASPQLHIVNRWDESGSNLPQRVEIFSREKGYAGRCGWSESLPEQLEIVFFFGWLFQEQPGFFLLV